MKAAADATSSGSLTEVRQWLHHASRVVVLSGAGISTDSGVPDFRGPAGVWTRDPSMQRLVDLDAWLGDRAVRAKGWQWLSTWSLDELLPNKGHQAIVELHRQGKLLLCVTQNTEGLHERAGLPADRLVTIHGSRRHVNCMGRNQDHWLDFSQKPTTPEEPASVSDVRSDCDFWCYSKEVLQRVEDGDDDPRCPVCGFILKTANISFGQSLVQADIQRAMVAAKQCDLLLVVGTQLSVYPVADMVPIAKIAGARVVIVNAEPTAMDHLADVTIQGSISVVLPELICCSSSL